MATIVGVWFVTLLIPGPNFLATAYTATTQSRRLGLFVVCGIAVGTAVWATASLLGLGFLFSTAAWLYEGLKLAGAVYLIYFGIKTIRSARRVDRPVALPRTPASAHQAFWRGVVVDLSNPKAAVFFTSLFAITVPPAAPIWFKAFIIAAVVIMAGGWYAAVACMVNLGPVAHALRRAQKAVAYVSGTVFVALGISLALER